MDGKGYPDRLKGAQIPLGARIIKVCDAIDAMLSDRPYRKALQLDKVREQLTKYAGTQFDPDVVEIVVRSTVLEEHRAKLVNEGMVEPRRAAALSSGRIRSLTVGA